MYYMIVNEVKEVILYELEWIDDLFFYDLRII